MKALLLALCAASLLIMAGCNNSNGSGANNGNGGGANTNFANLVTNLVQQPADGSPVSTNDRNFTNLSTGNANAFANVDFGAVDTPPGTSLATTACNANAACKPGIHGPQ